MVSVPIPSLGSIVTREVPDHVLCDTDRLENGPTTFFGTGHERRDGGSRELGRGYSPNGNLLCGFSKRIEAVRVEILDREPKCTDRLLVEIFDCFGARVLAKALCTPGEAIPMTPSATGLGSLEIFRVRVSPPERLHGALVKVSFLGPGFEPFCG